jgi:hypothetical protein
MINIIKEKLYLKLETFTEYLIRKKGKFVKHLLKAKEKVLAQHSQK